MKRILFIQIALIVSSLIIAQEIPQNTADKLLDEQSSKIQIGGYAQIDYNQPIEKGKYQNGNMDVHRLVLLFGYRFNEKVNFITEIEFEHVKEVFVEQAFLNFEILPFLHFRSGLMLVPMGIVNEYHEPPAFNGVERPNLDSKVVPSTWREIGAGFTGYLDEASIKYQVYLMNGFNGYNGNGVFRGIDGFRKGRQKGAESFMRSPSLSTKIDFYGIQGLKLGFSAYTGESQSSLYDEIDKNDLAALSQADSSVVGISMIGFDARYRNGGFEVKSQINIANISNTEKYNNFTGKDMGSQLFGWYLETGYNLLHSFKTQQKLVPFIRYEKYNTHAKTEINLVKNKAFDRTDITLGAGWWLASGAVLKADYQVFKTEENSSGGQLNFGIGIWF